MRTIIAGSRIIHNLEYVERAATNCGWQITAVISGGARGVDKMGEKFGYSRGLPVLLFPAEWNVYGNSAGYVRNVQMAKAADALIAIWDGKSPGTRNMIEVAINHNLKICVFPVRN